jgi:hypothetical protein
MSAVVVAFPVPLRVKVAAVPLTGGAMLPEIEKACVALKLKPLTLEVVMLVDRLEGLNV